jgi:hypothetical protein
LLLSGCRGGCHWRHRLIGSYRLYAAIAHQSSTVFTAEHHVQGQGKVNQAQQVDPPWIVLDRRGLGTTASSCSSTGSSTTSDSNSTDSSSSYYPSQHTKHSMGMKADNGRVSYRIVSYRLFTMTSSPCKVLPLYSAAVFFLAQPSLSAKVHCGRTTHKAQGIPLLKEGLLQYRYKYKHCNTTGSLFPQQASIRIHGLSACACGC